jgi:hypothetical protein
MYVCMFVMDTDAIDTTDAMDAIDAMDAMGACMTECLGCNRYHGCH